jgi:putative ABC transport system permease protein
MNLRRLVTRSFYHYLPGNLVASLGIAIATAVITGAFIIGDSLDHSLETAVRMRLGNITHSVTAGERLFTLQLAERFEKAGGMPVSPGLIAAGMAVTGGGERRLNRIQVLGIDKNFSSLAGTGFNYNATGQGQVIISENMARGLQLAEGDFFMLRMKRTGVIPMNTPLVSDAGQIVSRRVQVAAIAGNEELGRFNLQNSHSAPYNVFADISWLNSVMDLDGMANILFIAGPGSEKSDLGKYLKDSFRTEDASLVVRELPGTGITEVTSGRVFLNEHISSRLSGLFPGSTEFLTYFVNSAGKGDKSSPYFFVTADSRKKINPGEIVINRWLSEDISAGIGDTLILRYWETGTRRELFERDIPLLVREVIEMDQARGDSLLMPFLPGLSDAGSCRDWDAGVPVALEKIRDKDEEYWQTYRGTPRAYVSLGQGLQLWTNRFGNLTSIWLPEKVGGPEEAGRIIAGALDPAALGFQVNELREEGLAAAAGGVDFGMLFLGLGFFVMLAGLMLFFLLMLFNLENRAGQVRLFSSLGYPQRLIRIIFLGEGMLVALSGTFAGLLLAISYAWAVHHALSEIWQDVVRTDLLIMMVKPSALVSGFTAGIIAASLVIVAGINRTVGGRKNQHGIMNPVKNRIIPLGGSRPSFSANSIFSLISGSAALIMLLWQQGTGTYNSPVIFLIGGGLLLLSFILAIRVLLMRLESTGNSRISLTLMGMKNLARNPVRSMSVVILLALGIFVVVATGSHRKDAAVDINFHESGTGGFGFVAEATVPVLHNLNTGEARRELNIPPNVDFIQFMASYADDASCLNLNEVLNPRILSVDPSLLSGRFSFATGTKWLDRDNPWESLSADISGVIPAIADQAVIQWGMGRKVGDTLFYIDEQGGDLKLLLVGGLANSVFQGNVIISEENFLKHFPSTSGSSFFLVDTAPGVTPGETSGELGFIFRDHGWEMVTTVARLNEFHSVENTYLAIFLMLGALGVLIGTGGLAVVMARSIMERKTEIALLTALGYRRRQIFMMVFKEYLVLLIAGLTAGLLPALIAASPFLAAGNGSPGFIALIISGILLNGILWIVLVLNLMIKKTGLPFILRND